MSAGTESVALPSSAVPLATRRAGTEADKTKRVLPWLVALSFLMESLDTTILNTALPTIATSMGVGPLSLRAALTSYTLSLAVFIPLSGWMADRFGTRRVFFAAIALFTTASLACGLAANVPMLVASRVVQGVGGAMMMPVGRIAIVRTFTKQEILRAMSFVVIPGLIGPMLGPIVGGGIMAVAHWRAIFLVNLPIGLAGLCAVRAYMPDYRAERPPPPDYVGFILFGGGVALLSGAMDLFAHRRAASHGPLLLLVGVSLIAGYLLHAKQTRHPLLQLRLFRRRTFRVSVGGGFVSRLGIGGMPFLLPLLYQVGLGYTAIHSALLILPQPIAAMTSKLLVSRILGRWGYRSILRFNTLLIGALQLSFATITAATPAWLILVQAYVYGFLTSLQFTSVNTLQYADLEPHEASGGSTIGSILQQLALSFGVAIASLATSLFLTDSSGAHVSADAMARAVHHAFIVVGSLTMLSTLAFQGLQPRDGCNVSLHRHAVGAAG